MNSEQPLNLSFGPVAEAYDRGRPEYAPETVQWLLALQGSDPGRPLEVLELGAGTGKLTRALVDLGCQVHATDPDEGMLDVLARNVPEARTTLTSAESLPFEDRSFDVVVVAQAFHWFEAEQALTEIARVLRSTGHLALVWNEHDTQIPWVRRLSAVLDHDAHPTPTDGAPADSPTLAAVEPLIASRHFGVVDDAAFKFWQHINSESIVDLALSRSSIASLDAEPRAEKLAEVLAFYTDFGRGMDGMELPYVVRTFRTRVIERAQPSTPPAAVEAPAEPGEAGAESGAAGANEGDDPMQDTAVRVNRSQQIFLSDGTDTDMLLIDFR